MINLTDKEFLQAIFGDEYFYAHVTDFTFDPGAIPADRHLSAWKGDYFYQRKFAQVSNRYFTISTFYPDEKGIARRRKVLFKKTYCLVLDDVREKLSEVEAQKLPEPSWIMETSPGSFQWGYILAEPETNPSRIDNLNDGLIASDLAPSGKDPGQRGVTRYVRLPEGYNNKASKLVNGQPFKCQMLKWNPFNRVTLEQLAAPFHVDLNAPRREARVDGAAAISDHPLINIPDIIRIKEVRSDGRFDITCPWVDEHTGSDDSGSAVFTNSDGTIGFKCHHGACQSRTGGDLLRFIEDQVPGFGGSFTAWKSRRAFTELQGKINTPAQEAVLGGLSFDDLPRAPMAPAAPVPAADPLQQFYDELRRQRHDGPEAKTIAAEMLRLVEDLSKMDQLSWHKQICDAMFWSKAEFKEIIKDLREAWYQNSKGEVNFYDDVVYIGELNQFYDRRKRIFYSAEAYQNSYSHLDPDARKEALTGGRVTKVDKVDYAPKQTPIFEENGIIYANSWCSGSERFGAPGEIKEWLGHWEEIGWQDHMKHCMEFMAFTLLHPDKKINHMLLFGSNEGCGKDFLLYPMIRSLGDHSTTIAGEELLEGFNDYLLSTKHLHVNEAELGDRKEALAIAAKLKPLAAAPPEKLRVNQKNMKKIEVRNLLSVTMTTNSQLPLRLSGDSRRIYAMWSDMDVRDNRGEITRRWKDYWNKQWNWMTDQVGVDACMWYLRNCVDLSQFRPGEPPPVTEFLENIQNASKSPQHQTVEAFIANHVGAFKQDLLTSNEMVATLKSGNMLAQDLVYCDPSYFNPVRLGQILGQVSGAQQLRARHDVQSMKLWCVRNLERYSGYTQSELYRAYEEQRKRFVAETKIRAV